MDIKDRTRAKAQAKAKEEEQATSKAGKEGCNAEDHSAAVANVVASSANAAFATIVVHDLSLCLRHHCCT